MSVTAKGLLCVILTNKPDWRIYPKEIAKRSGMSRATVDKYFKELEAAQYMRSVKRSLGYKKGTEVIWFAADFKLTDWYFQDYVLPQLNQEQE